MTAHSPAQRPERPYLRLVVEPTQDRQQAWYARADADARLFLLRHGHLLADPSLTHWVVDLCAELVWEWRATTTDWSALRVSEVWLRLGNLHRFFPQPRLVVAFYETLQVFLPWLSAQGRLERGAALVMLEQLEASRSPQPVQARAQLVARHRFRSRSR